MAETGNPVPWAHSKLNIPVDVASPCHFSPEAQKPAHVTARKVHADMIQAQLRPSSAFLARVDEESGVRRAVGLCLTMVVAFASCWKNAVPNVIEGN